MSEVAYMMVIEPAEDEHGQYFAAYFPDLPGCTTMGDSLDELERNAREAVRGHIKALKELGKPVPPPRLRAGSVTVRVA